MDTKKKKEMQKMQKRASKLADLVYTKEFFLYKSGQISNKCESDFLVCYLFLLATVWTRDKRGQMPPNDTKRKWLLLMWIIGDNPTSHPVSYLSRPRPIHYLLLCHCFFIIGNIYVFWLEAFNSADNEGFRVLFKCVKKTSRTYSDFKLLAFWLLFAVYYRRWSTIWGLRFLQFMLIYL